MYIITAQEENLVSIKEEYESLYDASDRLVELLGIGYTKVSLHNTAMEKSYENV